MTQQRINFDPHAVARMAERGISRTDVQWMLANGTRVPADQAPGRETRFAREGFLGKQLARVVYLDRPTELYVITVMWVWEVTP